MTPNALRLTPFFNLQSTIFISLLPLTLALGSGFAGQFSGTQIALNNFTSSNTNV
jgi:hypothetical protein